MQLPGGCRTTGMAILPHTDPEAAFRTIFALDIPFWPQLPHLSFYEDMYAQASHNFPGIQLDVEHSRVSFDAERFYADLGDYAAEMESEEAFRLVPPYSTVYGRFLQRDLSAYTSVHGQCIGPVSFGLKIFDEDKKPIIYRDDVREILFDFMARKVNQQYREIRQVHPRAFVWLDEPGLEMLFASYTGYPSEQAVLDYRNFLAQLEGPRGIHLCGNPDWSFLLRDLPLDILSADVYTNGEILIRYTKELQAFCGKRRHPELGDHPHPHRRVAGRSRGRGRRGRPDPPLGGSLGSPGSPRRGPGVAAGPGLAGPRQVLPDQRRRCRHGGALLSAVAAHLPAFA